MKGNLADSNISETINYTKKNLFTYIYMYHIYIS